MVPSDLQLGVTNGHELNHLEKNVYVLLILRCRRVQPAQQKHEKADVFFEGLFLPRKLPFPFDKVSSFRGIYDITSPPRECMTFRRKSLKEITSKIFGINLGDPQNRSDFKCSLNSIGKHVNQVIQCVFFFIL